MVPAALAAALLAPALLHAHANTTTSSEIHVGAGDARILLKTLARDLAFVREDLDLDRDGTLGPAEVAAAREAVGSLFLDACRVTSGGVPCAGRVEDVALAEDAGQPVVAVRMGYRLGTGKLAFSIRPYAAHDPLHQHVTILKVEGSEARTLFFQGGADFEADPPAGMGFRGAVRLGVIHILTGWDHLMFLAGLLLAARTWRAMLLVISGFTAGHCATLLMAGSGFLVLPSRWVEAGIALSVAWVALDNLGRAEPRGRWALASGFGLVHGLGFAGDLQELFSGEGMLKGVLGFNLGVETGQVAVVGLMWPFLERLRRVGRLLNVLLAAAGLALLLARLLGP